jgi:hypothetical protein
MDLRSIELRRVQTFPGAACCNALGNTTSCRANASLVLAAVKSGSPPGGKKAPGLPGAQKNDLMLIQRLDIEIHKEFIRMRAQAQRVMLLRFHLDPVVKKVFVKHITPE